jgi:para-nitrobenzyl esterase
VDISFITGDYRYGPITGYVYPEGPQRDQMERSIMTAWAGMARSGVPGPVAGIEWPVYSARVPTFLHLDTDDKLRLATESETLASLVGSVAGSDALDSLQQCLLVWETLTKVGEPDYSSYSTWNDGQCASVDASAEQTRINASLREEYGSETVL